MKTCKYLVSIALCVGMGLMIGGCEGDRDNGGSEGSKPPGYECGPYGVQIGTATYVTPNVSKTPLIINYLWSNGTPATYDILSNMPGPAGHRFTATLNGKAVGLPGETHTLLFETVYNYGVVVGMRLTIDGQYTCGLVISIPA